ncbi:HNH endonuclease family protein [Amnibacterium sp. CER49]|uniref:HNH endonuclease family protein n=1 Tax=Amnibacterium sp. CER49 TaxID=3039161 RepID=UPI00244897C1|nr:HNH endonuclease family protein [Amnibacterium sp. CER49]MDH2443044.1 HNH endonuclease family protein [Amnibacterium sp. CER49]
MARRGSRGAAPVGLVLLVAVLVVAIGALSSLSRTSGSATTPSVAPSAGTALALLATLPVRGKAPLTGYDRVRDFGAAWLDVDRNGCDTRDDVLRRDLTRIRATGCRVRSGVLADPYTKRVIDFVRGARTSEAVQIDHVVPLAAAWRTGAQRLSQAQRERLANDPIELFAVDGPTNQAKGDADAASWLPPNRAFRCTYVAHQVAVKAAYALWVTPAERDAMQQVLAHCPSTPAPRSALAR